MEIHGKDIINSDPWEKKLIIYRVPKGKRTPCIYDFKTKVSR